MTYQNLNLTLAKTLLLSYILTNAISIKLEKNILYLKNSIYIYIYIYIYTERKISYNIFILVF